MDFTSTVKIMNAERLSPSSMRVVRPVSQIAASLRFYVDILGLERLGGFAGHDGYDGAFVGRPGSDGSPSNRQTSGYPRPPGATAGPNRASGMLWGIESVPGTNRRLVLHSGPTGGYSSFLGLAPNTGQTVIVLANVARASDRQRIAVGLMRRSAAQVRSDPDDRGSDGYGCP